MKITAVLCALVLGVVGAVNPAAAQEAAPEPLSAFPQSLLAVRTQAGKVINFKVWTANTPRREQQGLMFVREMDEHAGMLFIFPADQQPSMWMKNTYMSLDLLFINARGRIEYIAPRATPLSLSVIQAPSPSMAVLELKGGASERLGLKAGDLVLHGDLHDTQRTSTSDRRVR